MLSPAGRGIGSVKTLLPSLPYFTPAMSYLATATHPSLEAAREAGSTPVLSYAGAQAAALLSPDASLWCPPHRAASLAGSVAEVWTCGVCGRCHCPFHPFRMDLHTSDLRSGLSVWVTAHPLRTVPSLPCPAKGP